MNTEIEILKQELKDAYLALSYLSEQGWGEGIAEEDCPAFIEHAIKSMRERDERLKANRERKKLNSIDKT